MSDARATMQRPEKADGTLQPATRSPQRPLIGLYKLHRAHPHPSGRGFVRPTSFRSALRAGALSREDLSSLAWTGCGAVRKDAFWFGARPEVQHQQKLGAK
jgi:hypothetical protein